MSRRPSRAWLTRRRGDAETRLRQGFGGQARAQRLVAIAAVFLLVAGCSRQEPPGPAQASILPPLKPFENKVQYVLAKKIVTGMRQLQGLAVDADGRLLTASADGIGVFNAEGRRAACWKTSAPARCVTAEANGTVWAGLTDRIEAYDAQGRRVSEWGTPGRERGELSYVTGIGVSGMNVFVADAGNRVIRRFDKTGDFINVIGERDPRNEAAGIHGPGRSLDLAVDAEGVLHVANPGRLRVDRYTANGEYLDSWGKPGLDPDAFSGCCNPIHLALGPAGRIVTVEKGLPRIKVHDATGNLLAVLGTDLVPEGAGETDQSAQPGMAPDGSAMMREFFGGVAVDAQGRIYVASPRTGLVYVFEAQETKP